MSSLAATQADGYYLPPEFYEASQKNPRLTKNQWFAAHQQDGTTAKIKTVRFELPYNALCLHCDAYLSRGTRYNATKHKVDKDNVQIEFHMKCRSCAVAIFVIRTDPANQCYRYIQGLQRLERNERKQQEQELQSDLERVERYEMGLRQAELEWDQLKQIQQHRQTRFDQDADQNAVARARYRRKRQRQQQQTAKSQACGWNPRRTQFLSETTTTMRVRAMETTFGKSVREQEREQYQQVQKTSIFSSSSSPQPDAIVSSSSSASSRRRSTNTKTTVDLTQDPAPRTKRKIQVLPLGSRSSVSAAAVATTTTETKPPPSFSDLIADYSSDSSAGE